MEVGNDGCSMRLGELIAVCGEAELWRVGAVLDQVAHSTFWAIYDAAFRPVNEATPIMQSYSMEEIQLFLRRDDVVKIIAIEDDTVVALGMIFSDLSLDPWISREFFRIHYGDRPVYYIPALAVVAGHRPSLVVIEVLRKLINEVPADGVGVFDYSEGVNPRIPKLADFAGRGHIEGHLIDKKPMVAYEWVGRTHVEL